MAVATFISYKSYKKNNKLKKYYKILTFSIFSYFIGSLADIFNVNYFASSISRSFYLACTNLCYMSLNCPYIYKMGLKLHFTKLICF